MGLFSLKGFYLLPSPPTIPFLLAWFGVRASSGSFLGALLFRAVAKAFSLATVSLFDSFLTV